MEMEMEMESIWKWIWIGNGWKWDTISENVMDWFGFGEGYQLNPRPTEGIFGHPTVEVFFAIAKKRRRAAPPFFT